MIIDKLSEEVSSSSFPIIDHKKINDQLSLIKSYISRGIWKKVDMELLKVEFLTQWTVLMEIVEKIVSNQRTEKQIAFLTSCFYQGRDLFMKLLTTDIKNPPIS